MRIGISVFLELLEATKQHLAAVSQRHQSFFGAVSKLA
jgi:hypothetical protein